MKRITVYILVGMLLMLVLATPAFSEEQTYKKWTAQQDVSASKVWKIKFNSSLRESTVSSQNIYVQDQSGSNFLVKVSLDPSDDTHKTALVEPQSAYKEGTTYTLYILKNVTSQGSHSLKQDIRMDFTIATGSSPYLFGVVSSIDEDSESVYVDIAGKGDNIKYDYGESWYSYNKASLVMLDNSGNIVPILSGNLIMDQIWDFSNSKIKFVNHSGSFQVASGVMIKLVDQNGDCNVGQLADLSTAVDAGKNVRVLLDPTTQKIVVIVIEQ